MRLQERMTLRVPQIFSDHLGAHLLRRNLRFPAKFLFRLGRIAKERLDFGWSEIPWVNPHDDVADLYGRRAVAGDGLYCCDFFDIATGELKLDTGPVRSR